MAQLEQTRRELSATLALVHEARARHDARSEHIDRLVERSARATHEREVQSRNYTRTLGELEEFKEKVTDVASRYAKPHDWCAVVDKALEELGLERPLHLHGDAPDHRGLQRDGESRGGDRPQLRVGS